MSEIGKYCHIFMLLITALYYILLSVRFFQIVVWFHKVDKNVIGIKYKKMLIPQWFQFVDKAYISTVKIHFDFNTCDIKKEILS